MTVKEILRELKALSDPGSLEGMARFGIKTSRAYGVSVPALRRLAKRAGKNHVLARQLWQSGIHEARILAGMIEDPREVTERQMDRWARDFDSWDLCDQCCSNLFDKTSFAYQKAVEWSGRKEEFVKRAGFVLMAVLAVHDKKASDRQFKGFFSLIKRESTDQRNFVKKAVNWALRQIGKRTRPLNKIAIQTAEELSLLDSPSSKWIARDALKELTSKSVQHKWRLSSGGR